MNRTERKGATDAIMWAIDAMAYDPAMAKGLIDKAIKLSSDDRDVKELLLWARDQAGKDKRLAREMLADAVLLLTTARPTVA